MTDQSDQFDVWKLFKTGLQYPWLVEILCMRTARSILFIRTYHISDQTLYITNIYITSVIVCSAFCISKCLFILISRLCRVIMQWMMHLQRLQILCLRSTQTVSLKTAFNKDWQDEHFSIFFFHWKLYINLALKLNLHPPLSGNGRKWKIALV